MANECKLQFYFRRADIEKLLAANPKAKGVIVSQEIVPEKLRGLMKMVNIAKISARVDPMPKKKAAAQNAKSAGRPDGEPTEVDGCPYPPGCTDN